MTRRTQWHSLLLIIHHWRTSDSHTHGRTCSGSISMAYRGRSVPSTCTGVPPRTSCKKECLKWVKPERSYYARAQCVLQRQGRVEGAHDKQTLCVLCPKHPLDDPASSVSMQSLRPTRQEHLSYINASGKLVEIKLGSHSSPSFHQTSPEQNRLQRKRTKEASHLTTGKGGPTREHMLHPYAANKVAAIEILGHLEQDGAI